MSRCNGRNIRQVRVITVRDRDSNPGPLGKRGPGVGRDKQLKEFASYVGPRPASRPCTRLYLEGGMCTPFPGFRSVTDDPVAQRLYRVTGHQRDPRRAPHALSSARHARPCTYMHTPLKEDSRQLLKTNKHATQGPPIDVATARANLSDKEIREGGRETMHQWTRCFTPSRAQRQNGTVTPSLAQVRCASHIPVDPSG